jgi:hypothetical protein
MEEIQKEQLELCQHLKELQARTHGAKDTGVSKAQFLRTRRTLSPSLRPGWEPSVKQHGKQSQGEIDR